MEITGRPEQGYFTDIFLGRYFKHFQKWIDIFGFCGVFDREVDLNIMWEQSF